MRKINPIQKFFQDYPIVLVMFFLSFAAFGIVYWFVRPHHQKPVPQKSKIAHHIVKKERDVKITPAPVQKSVTVLEQTTQNPIVQKPQLIQETPVPAQNLPAPSLPIEPSEPGMLMESATETPRVEAAVKPQIFFVIDDLGYHKKFADLLFSIDRPLTVAILPQLSFSKFYAEEGIKHGFTTILHQPLEPESKTEDPGPGLITVDMKTEDIERIFEQNLLTVPNVVGINNHMGSRATCDRRVMYVLAREIKKHHLFFLDSMTHSKSIAHNVTFALGVPTFQRDVFLDNQDDYDLITKQIHEAAEVAKKHGKAVAIGHIRQNTLQAIKDAIPTLEAEGFEIVALKGKP